MEFAGIPLDPKQLASKRAKLAPFLDFMRFGAQAGPIRPQLGPNTGLVCVHPRAVR